MDHFLYRDGVLHAEDVSIPEIAHRHHRANNGQNQPYDTDGGHGYCVPSTGSGSPLTPQP
jgi:hypothetical protein